MNVQFERTVYWIEFLLINFFTSFAVIRVFKAEIAQQNVETGSMLDNTPSLRWNLILKKFPFMHGTTEKEGTGIFYTCFNKKLFKSCASFVILFR